MVMRELEIWIIIKIGFEIELFWELVVFLKEGGIFVVVRSYFGVREMNRDLIKSEDLWVFFR